MSQIEQLQKLIDDSKRIVFFGGAGVSTESNIPDFRSADGLYHEKYKYPPEQIVSHTFFVRKTELFYDFYSVVLAAIIYKEEVEIIIFYAVNYLRGFFIKKIENFRFVIAGNDYIDIIHINPFTLFSALFSLNYFTIP